MDLTTLTKEELTEIPLVEIAYELMEHEGKPFNYYDLFDKIIELKELTKAEAEDRIAKLYTDINLDGRFHSMGDNQWGLKKWYPLEQTDEEITSPIKPRRAKSASAEDEDEFVDFEDFEDEYEDLEDALDEVANDEDEDDDDEDIDLDDDEIDEIDEELDDEDFDEEDEFD